MSPLGIRASKVRSWRSSLLQSVCAGRLGPTIVVLLGFLLGMYRLDYQSVWYDEALSLTRSRLPLAEMMAKVSQDFVHPPLHNFLLYVWYKIVGFGAWQSRLLSVIFHTLAIVIMYQLAQYLFEHRMALLSALLLTVSQLGVMYAQEARAYAQLLFFVLCTIYLCIRPKLIT
jgi:uncharacterized membrane protein